MQAVEELEEENDQPRDQEAWLRQLINEVYDINATFIAHRDALQECNRQIIKGRVQWYTVIIMMETLLSGCKDCQWYPNHDQDGNPAVLMQRPGTP